MCVYVRSNTFFLQGTLSPVISLAYGIIDLMNHLNIHTSEN